MPSKRSWRPRSSAPTEHTSRSREKITTACTCPAEQIGSSRTAGDASSTAKTPSNSHPAPGTYTKGNACLTCSVFVTDTTHEPALRRQLHKTTEIISRATTEFEQQHDGSVPREDVRLTHRRVEHTGILDTLAATPADMATPQCTRPTAEPVLLTLEPTRKRRNAP